MTQRSPHAVTKAYYKSMSCFATDSHTKWPRLQCWGFPHKVAPFAPCGSGSSQRMSQRRVTKTGHKDGSHPHSIEHDTQPIACLISKQAVPYRTRGDTCCPVGSTPKIWSLADPSMTNHITWQNTTVSTIPTLLKPQHRISLGSIHISTDGRPSLTKTQAKLNITKDGKTCTTLMTTWLSITTQYNPNPKVWGLGTILNHAGQCVY
jgi:hypothetical protein